MVKNKLFLEVGINHFGSTKLANEYLKFFLNSDFKYLTFMIHNQNFYDKMKKKKKNFILPISFYKKAIKAAHKRKKKIGLSVCDLKSYQYIKNLSFDFYKILGVAINNEELIKYLRLKKRNFYISLSSASNAKIKKCIQYFKTKKNLSFIYTAMSYDSKDLSLNLIKYIRDKYKLPVGYGNHFKNSLPIYLSTFFNPSFYFIYIKLNTKKKILYPDNTHSFFINELEEICDNITDTNFMLEKKKLENKIKIKSIIHEKKI